MSLARRSGGADERFDTYYGLYISQSLRGEVEPAHETAEAFLRDARSEGRKTELAAANRIVGMSFLSQGALEDAQAHLSEALLLYDPERDRDAKFRFGADTGAAAACYLAQTRWYLGEVDHAIELVEESRRRAGESGHPPTLALIYHLAGMFEMQRGNAAAALRVSEALLELTEEHQMALYHGHGSVHASWARAQLGEGETGVANLVQAITAYTDLGANLYLPFYQGLLAQLEGERQNARTALTRIDDALALSQQTGTRWIDAFLHNIRGATLLKCEPTDTAPAEQAFLSAIAIAQQQKAKSFELLAAVSLAKLYQSANRAVDAHGVLASALEGFAPTPEFPEIGEAQVLLAALAEAEDVKSAVAARQQRLKLQTSYGQAMLHARGYSAPETKAAFARARELTAGIEDPSERFSVLFGLWANGFVSGQLAPTREIADIMLREVAARPDSPEACTAARLNGTGGKLRCRARRARTRPRDVRSGTGCRSRRSFCPGYRRRHHVLSGAGLVAAGRNRAGPPAHGPGVGASKRHRSCQHPGLCAFSCRRVRDDALEPFRRRAARRSVARHIFGPSAADVCGIRRLSTGVGAAAID